MTMGGYDTGYEAGIDSLIHDIYDLQDENFKLRELVRIMAYCMQRECECDGCRLNGADGTITEPVGCIGMYDRMRGLGVEVNR